MVRNPHNLSEMRARRKQLRHNLTKYELKFWHSLDNGNLHTWRFRRQHSVGRYVLDFYCFAGKLAVEIDGKSHCSEEAIKYDAIRTDYLNRLGIKVLRFTNEMVQNRLNDVLLEILQTLESGHQTE